MQSVNKATNEMETQELTNLSAEVARLVATFRENGPLPPQQLMNIIGSPNTDHFLGNMQLFAQEILVRCHGTRRSHIVDVGSGCGRLSLPFSRFLGSAGRYVGIEVWEQANDWCRAHMQDVVADVSFITQAARNNYYFEPDNGMDNDFRMEQLASDSFDVGVALSIFNHLKKKDVLAYISELSRVLKPGAAAYITGFVIDDAFFDYVARSGLHTQVREDAQERGCYYAYTLQDFFAGFTLPVWYEMFRAYGLRVACFETGSWAEKKGARLYQDSFIVEKLR